MKVFNHYKLLLVMFSFISAQSVYADNLGRIFTTPDERQKLEKIRLKKEPVKKFEVVAVKKEEEPEVVIEKETIIRDPITLKGLVHRSDGKSTAWVNDSNTFQGDLDSQFIQVPDSKIESDQVTVIMSEDNNQVELRVGDVYTPEPIEKETVITVDGIDN